MGRLVEGEGFTPRAVVDIDRHPEPDGVAVGETVSGRGLAQEDHTKPANDDRKETTARIHRPRVGNIDEQTWGIPLSGVIDERHPQVTEGIAFRAATTVDCL